MAARYRQKANGGRVSSRANQCGTLDLESVHSQNEVAGTKQRKSDAVEIAHGTANLSRDSLELSS